MDFLDINRSSMLILHPTSLPNGYGIGDFGKESYRFVDLLNESKTKVWQVLPLGITDNIEYNYIINFATGTTQLGKFCSIQCSHNQ